MSKSILLVEYDESTIHVIKEIFPPPAFEVLAANDGETAKKLLHERAFDLMITAAMLPRFHGFNLALAVSQEYPGIKIIVISAIYKGLEYRHQAITQYRANDFFEKPLQRERFRARVLDLLGMSEADLAPAAQSAATRVPMFDTAKIPAPDFAEGEGGKLSSADIFGDIIQKIDQVPAFEIDLNEGVKSTHGKGASAPARKEEPRPSPPAQTAADPGSTVMMKPKPPETEAPKPGLSGHRKGPLNADLKSRTRMAAPSFDLDTLRVVKKSVPSPDATAVPLAGSERIDASLEGLRTQQAKPEARQKEMRKIEDDIARKFEDTLSGLGLGRKPTPPRPASPQAQTPPPPRPDPKPIIMPEIKAVPKLVVPVTPPPRPAAEMPAATAPVTAKVPATVVVSAAGTRDELKDEIIDLGEAAIIQEPESPVKMPLEVILPPAPKEPAPAKKVSEEVAEVKEARPEKKAPEEDNPNEVGDYVLLGMIARGGMAEIYKAKKKGVKGFEKVIAIKKILSGYGEDDKYIEMLVDEAKIAAELSHPNIVQIYDLGRKDNYYFIAMEYVLGKDLREIQTRLRERDQWFPEEIAILLTIKILEALNYAHKAKDSRGRSLDIVHRDVSPPNILISYSGDVKLTDFGVSKASIKIHQTLSGALKGKLLYMSPEQACGESSIDYRSDLYSAGVVLFELLTGKKLFLDTSEMLVLKKVQNGEIINPREINPDIDPALEKILLTSLNKECDKRYQSAAAMIADLEAYLHKKLERAPGPVHLSHFIFGLFEGDIQREGIKVDLKPLPYMLKAREVPKPPPPIEKPQPAAALPPPAPPPPPEESVSIRFDEDPFGSTSKKRSAPKKTEFKPESLFHELGKEKKKSPLLAPAAVLLVGAIAAGLYFFVINKPSASSSPALKETVAPALKPGETVAAAALQTPEGAAKQAEMKKIADELAATQKLLDEAKLKQEEELKKLLAEEERKKLLEERRKKTESDRLQRDEEARLKQEEAELLKQEENARLNQEDAARLKKTEEERRLAEEKKLAEIKRVKEGDIVPMNEVDAEPVAISTPAPNIPDSVRSAMADNQSIIFSILINHNGDVETVRMLRKTNNGQLNSILTDTVKSYKYQPARKDNLRVKVWKTIPMSIKK